MNRHHPRSQQNPFAKRPRAIIVISAMAEKRPALAIIPDQLRTLISSVRHSRHAQMSDEETIRELQRKWF